VQQRAVRLLCLAAAAGELDEVQVSRVQVQGSHNTLVVSLQCFPQQTWLPVHRFMFSTALVHPCQTLHATASCDCSDASTAQVLH